MNARKTYFIVATVLFTFFAVHTNFGQRVKVSIVTDEAELVLKTLRKLSDGRTLSDSDLRPIFESEGYRRLKAREHSMGRKFEDADFRVFLESEELAARKEGLQKILEEWKKADVAGIGRSVLKYLPASATIKAKIYPVIKPATNSFVFDLQNDPAIFLYLDENLTRPKFENTLAHELHHIGFGTACPTAEAKLAEKQLSEGEKKVLRWTGAFGEGFAMLAAAGGPDLHPHAESSGEDRARWDRDMENFGADLLKVQAFFGGLLSGKLSDKEEIERARSFYGIQGPWYTVGWKMAVVIEEELGRPALIDCFCDGRKLLPAYNRAAEIREKKTGEKLARWDPAVFVGPRQ
jgi:hypothetical protein